jgi:hypothetical protein
VQRTRKPRHRLPLCEIRATDLRDRLHHQHPQPGPHVSHGSHCGPVVPGAPLHADHPEKGVLIPCRFTLEPTSSQNSMSVCQSRPLRASREALIETTAPTPILIDRSEELLETGAGEAGAGTGRSSSIASTAFQPKARAVDQTILAAPAFAIVEKLVARRLANIDKGSAGGVLRRDFGHHWPPHCRDRHLAKFAVAPPARRRPVASGGAASACSAARAAVP